ncbi:MAG: FHA domain-containing protein [Chloroflexi bacterium]|nr:FHA domain-containing protein [Chloroflexota bacterium]
MKDKAVKDLFSEFVRLRQAGQSRDSAWLEIESRANEMASAERERLLSYLVEWEAREGRNYQPAQPDPYATQIKPYARVQEVLQREAEAQAAPVAPRSNVIRRIARPQTAAPVASGEISCPVCHQPNQPGERYCYRCGTLLEVGFGKTRQIDDAELPEADDSPCFFSDGMALYLQVRGVQQPIRVVPRQNEMVIGRSAPDGVMLPDINLGPYQGETMGISRLHAGLKRQGDALVLTDLGSLNHTYINGQRLLPHEVRVLRDGDELRFGKLAVRVYFRQG